MALNEELKNRIYNMKFDQAIQYLDKDVTGPEKEAIEALSRCFGNCGWSDGDIGTILELAVYKLIGDGYGENG